MKCKSSFQVLPNYSINMQISTNQKRKKIIVFNLGDMKIDKILLDEQLIAWENIRVLIYLSSWINWSGLRIELPQEKSFQHKQLKWNAKISFSKNEAMIVSRQQGNEDNKYLQDLRKIPDKTNY